MTTSPPSSSTIGWVAIATGVSVILAIVLFILMYTVDMFFGKINDVFNSIIGILSAILAWMLYIKHHSKTPLISQIAFLLAVVGALFTIVGSILIIFDFTGFLLAGWYSGVGNALIGLWLMAFCYWLLRNNSLPRNLVIFGTITGIFMAIGLLGIPAIFARIDSMRSMPWYLYLALFGWFGTYVLYPIWTLWLGRNLILR